MLHGPDTTDQRDDAAGGLLNRARPMFFFFFLLFFDALARPSSLVNETKTHSKIQITHAHNTYMARKHAVRIRKILLRHKYTFYVNT